MTTETESASEAHTSHEKDVHENGFVRLQPRTHDISLIENHISSIEQLGADLDTAIRLAWPKRHDIRYTEVHVLLLSWVDDDLGVFRELDGLKKILQGPYNFRVQEYLIPSSKPDQALKRRMLEFLELDGKEILLIVYYGGHARRARESNEASLWFANRLNPTPAIPSGGIQSLLEEADADVLFLLDCCHSAAAPTSDSQQGDSGVLEVIAACGYETIAPEVDKHSFTKSLIETLALMANRPPFSIGELHSRVLGKLKCWSPSLARDESGSYMEDIQGRLLFERQPRKTPIYSIICETTPRRNIILGPLPHIRQNNPFYSLQVHDNGESSSSQRGRHSRHSISSSTSRGNEESSKAFKAPCPQIIVAVRLEKDFDRRAWVDWICSAPQEAKEISVEGVYQSFSTLLLVRMPVTVWNLLPDNSAYSFVGFVTSGNMVADEVEVSKVQVDEISKTMSKLEISQTSSSQLREVSPAEGSAHNDHLASQRNKESIPEWLSTMLVPGIAASSLFLNRTLPIMLPLLRASKGTEAASVTEHDKPSSKINSKDGPRPSANINEEISTQGSPSSDIQKSRRRKFDDEDTPTMVFGSIHKNEQSQNSPTWKNEATHSSEVYRGSPSPSQNPPSSASNFQKKALLHHSHFEWVWYCYYCGDGPMSASGPVQSCSICGKPRHEDSPMEEVEVMGD